MVAHDAEQVDDLAVGVVEDFRLWPGGSAQEHTAHAGEGFGVAGVGALPSMLSMMRLAKYFLPPNHGATGFGCRRGPTNILTRFQRGLPRYSSRRVRGGGTACVWPMLVVGGHAPGSGCSRTPVPRPGRSWPLASGSGDDSATWSVVRTADHGPAAFYGRAIR